MKNDYQMIEYRNDSVIKKMVEIDDETVGDNVTTLIDFMTRIMTRARIYMHL